MRIHDLQPNEGANKRKKRVARGIAGKGGKTAGRGTKGQKARNTVPVWFEGGQMPLHKRIPKLRGFNNPFRVEYQAINLDTIAESGLTEVTPETLLAKGLISKGSLVKILGRGELTGKVDLTPGWRVSGNYSLLRLDVDAGAESLLGGAHFEQSSPRNQALLWSSWDVACDWEVDLIARYVDSLPSIDIDSYIAMDLRVGWRPSEALECSVVAQNLLDAAHGEYRGGGLQSISTDARRGVYGALQWRY